MLMELLNALLLALPKLKIVDNRGLARGSLSSLIIDWV